LYIIYLYIESLFNVLTGKGLPGVDPGILERGGPVRGRSPEPSAESASAGGGSGGLPQNILKN